MNNLDEYIFVHECGLRVGRGGISTKICGESVVCMPRILIDTSTGLQVRNFQSGASSARARALAVGPVTTYPLPAISLPAWALRSTFVAGVVLGVSVVLYWIFQL